MKNKAKLAVVTGLLALVTSIAAAAVPSHAKPCKGHVGKAEKCEEPACVLGDTCCDC